MTFQEMPFKSLVPALIPLGPLGSKSVDLQEMPFKSLVPSLVPFGSKCVGLHEMKGKQLGSGFGSTRIHLVPKVLACKQ